MLFFVDQDAESFMLRSIFQANYTKGIDFKMPEGAPPYTPNENEEKSLDSKAFNDYIKKSMNFRDKQYVREQHFINLLQDVAPKDAELLVAMKDKKVTDIFPTLTKELIKEAFPKLV